MVCRRWSDSGEFKNVDLFFKILCDLGPQFWYFLEKRKSSLVGRGKDVEKTENFKWDNGSSLKIKTGYRYLGSYIGEE